MDPRFLAVKDQDVYTLSEKGGRALHEPGVALSATDLAVLVLIDGQATVAQVVRSAQGLAPETVRDTLRNLLQGELIESFDQSKSDLIDAGDLLGSVARADPSAGPGADSEAALGVSSLRDRGYFVRIAKRAAGSLKRVEGKKISILSVEDDPDLCKLLRTYLALEGYATRSATNREEIAAALEQSPPPDLVLLDVTLPDANGFAVLAEMRRHAAFKSVPVIMLTGEATREAVLKGLVGGADGYVTKPFEMEVLTNAVRVVLGLVGATPDSGITGLAVKPQDGVDPEYRDRLLEKLARLEALRADLASGKAPAARLADLHREVHTIAGSAQMFGLGAAAVAARALEQFLETYRAGDAAPGPDGRVRIKLLLEAITRAAQGR